MPGMGWYFIIFCKNGNDLFAFLFWTGVLEELEFYRELFNLLSGIC